MACRSCSRADTLPATTQSICSLPVTRLASSQRHLSTAWRRTVQVAPIQPQSPRALHSAYDWKMPSVARRNLSPHPSRSIFDGCRGRSLPCRSYAAGFGLFSQRFNCIASSAAAVSACFLLRPLPWPRTIPSQTTCTTNVFSCSGPLCEISS